jgi:LTXXQ motif family protein
MSRLAAALALAGAFAITSAAHAQQRDTGARRPPRGALNRQPNQIPMGPPRGAPMGAPQLDVASMLLAHTGDFKLTDPQVTRLAAIARRTADRRTAMRASADSLRASRGGPPAAGQDAPRPQGPPPAALALMQKMRDQAHADLRDAIAVLTVDQQAMGWEMMARRGAPGGQLRSFTSGPGGGMNRGMMRGGMGARAGGPPQPRMSPPEQ